VSGRTPGKAPTGRAGRRHFGQHFIGNSRLAARLVDDAGVTRDDRVVELGAGCGVLTAALAERAGQVLAVELDPKLVAALARRFASARNVAVLCADARHVPLPANPYRVLANLPFNVMSATLRRLLDTPASRLGRADLVVQWHVARQRVGEPPAVRLRTCSPPGGGRGGSSAAGDGSRPAASGRPRRSTPRCSS
jgi:16S rRNA A1518/A1519 N6-dimethyltransferase RsmA/KsgA/DIM1 with predicted DNA glycosylase/AP lyase activity